MRPKRGPRPETSYLYLPQPEIGYLRFVHHPECDQPSTAIAIEYRVIPLDVRQTRRGIQMKNQIQLGSFTLLVLGRFDNCVDVVHR